MLNAITNRDAAKNDSTGHIFDAIVSRAEFLHERLESARLRGEKIYPSSRIAPEDYSHLEEWQRALGSKNPDSIAKRLHWERTWFDDIRRIVTEPPVTPQPRESDCRSILLAIFEKAKDCIPCAVHRATADAKLPLIPFEDLLRPALLVARKMLSGELRRLRKSKPLPVKHWVSRSAYRQLEFGLLQQLASISGQVLDHEFRLAKSFGQHILSIFDLPEAENGKELYQEFVKGHLSTGLVALFSAYPVMARLIANAILFWVEGTIEFLARYSEDWLKVSSTFDIAAPTITQFELFLSDPHRRGRSVIVVSFRCGKKVVYKPKPLQLDVNFNRILEWINRQEQRHRCVMKIAAVLDCGDYGWAEYVTHESCQDEDEVRCFYFQSGMLLGLLYVVGATDCHFENVIAHGKSPVLVDVETILCPDLRLSSLDQDFGVDGSNVPRELAESVLRTGLLPQWQGFGNQGAVYDISGLGCPNDRPRSYRQHRWKHVNTDAMHIASEVAEASAGKNVVWRDGVAMSPLNYVSEIADGFAFVYRLFRQQQDNLLSYDGPLAPLRSCSVRFLFRSTQIYATLKMKSLEPGSLENGVSFGICFEWLTRRFLAFREKPAMWPVFGAEVAALEQMDVPIFHVLACETTMRVGSHAVSDMFEVSGYEAMVRRLRAMSDVGLARQMELIEFALRAKVARVPSGDVRSGKLMNAKKVARLNQSDFILAAIAIGDEMEELALVDSGNRANWIGLKYIEEADCFYLDLLGDDLYGGRTGISLFLAALYSRTGEARFRALALQAIYELRKKLHKVDPDGRCSAVRRHGIGGAVGLGSLIYGLVRTSVFLGDAEILKDASTLAGWLSEDVISEDVALDVLGGAAAALLGLLSLYYETGSVDVLSAAIACGDHLIGQSNVIAGGQRAWCTISERPLTGFSHGAAGISFSLIRLASITGERAYFDAAVQGILFERMLFSDKHANWPDLRGAADGKELRYPIKWCHGAAGIALARSACRSMFEIDGIDLELESALRTTRKYLLQGTDNLCCGNLGRVEALLVAARNSGRSDWQCEAQLAAEAVLQQARAAGRYRLIPDIPDHFSLGLFQGKAGIGYQFLRVAYDDLPSVLIWE